MIQSGANLSATEGKTVLFDRGPRQEAITGAIIPAPSEARVFEWNRAHGPDAGIFGFDSKNIHSRPFNLLRTRILKLGKAREWRLFGVVSATPGVGKSFIASNLAAALSRIPEIDTYLMDFDLRRSSIARNFGFDEEVGLQQFLSGEVQTLGDAAFRLGEERLTVVPSGRSEMSSSELLATERLDKLVWGMRTRPPNSIFICDLPPAFANDDAAIVASKLDAYLLVVEEGKTTKKQIKDTMNMLSPATCAGTILNRYRGGMFSDDYGYGYGKAAAYAAYYMK